MFKVGDKVVHPLHGAGVVVSIDERNIADEMQTYYTIKMPGEVKVMIPTSKASEIGVRSIIDKDSAEKVFNVLEQDSTEMSMNWNKRYRDNMERMKTGNIYDVADIVRNLTFKQKEKGLSTGEKKMLLNAKQILVSELVLVEEKDKNEIESIVDKKIDESYALHTEANNMAENEQNNTNNVIKKFVSQA